MSKATATLPGKRRGKDEQAVIGVFDSGSGGLTILTALRARLPERDFLYLGDHARAPYGDRSETQVEDYTRAAVDWLLRAGCRLVIIACNTAAAVALRPLQQDWLAEHAPKARVLGVHVPLIEAITGAPWRPLPGATPGGPSRSIAIFATPLTVASGAFVIETRKRAGRIRVLQQPCPGLAEAIEENAGVAAVERLVERFAGALLAQPGAEDLEAAALACTHYPFAADQFRQALPDRMDILTQQDIVAESLADYLRRHPGQDTPGQGRTRLLTTGDPGRLDGLLSRLPAELRRFEPATLEA